MYIPCVLFHKAVQSIEVGKSSTKGLFSCEEYDDSTPPTGLGCGGRRRWNDPFFTQKAGRKKFGPSDSPRVCGGRGGQECAQLKDFSPVHFRQWPRSYLSIAIDVVHNECFSASFFFVLGRLSM